MTVAQTDPGLSHLRARLIRLAYRMLGSVAEAEDVVQNAYLRWLATDRSKVREPADLLHTVVTRLCLNELKSARRRRELYTGPWLPEPLPDPDEPETRDDITFALMIALERLSPLERAAFLLHDVFGWDFDAVARTINREPATCRKLASRARTHIQAARPRFPVSREQGQEIAAAFFAASRFGDMERLRALLAEGVTAHADGGGKVPASLHPLAGIDAVLERHAQLAAEFARAPSKLVRYAFFDGLPGFVTIEAGEIVQLTALEIDGDKISAIYVMRNPDKLRHLGLGSPGNRAGRRQA